MSEIPHKDTVKLLKLHSIYNREAHLELYHIYVQDGAFVKMFNMVL